MPRFSKYLAVLTPVVAALSACGESSPPTATEVVGPSFAQHANMSLSADLGAELAGLRALVAPLRQLEAAQAAGWSLQLTECIAIPGVAGMGYHWGNPAYIDGAVAVLEPEVMVFSPAPNGSVRLGAVEYIVPIPAWQGEEPPELFGLPFHRLEPEGLWILHVWLGINNPTGLFEDFNPRVSCS